MSKPKIIYVGHGQMVEMRICLSEYDTNYQAWQDQMRPDTMLIRVMDSREIRVSDISVNVMDWHGKVQYLPDKDKRIAELEADLLTGDKLLRKAEAKLDAVGQDLISLLQLPIVVFEHQDEDGDTFTVDYFRAESVRSIVNKALGEGK